LDRLRAWACDDYIRKENHEGTKTPRNATVFPSPVFFILRVFVPWWFPPSAEQTGYNRTMAAASANTPAISLPEEKPRRRWFQFSLRTALILMFLASLFFAGFAWGRNRAERQGKIVAELRELGAQDSFAQGGNHWILVAWLHCPMER
jgi:hypothetical protein